MARIYYPTLDPEPNPKLKREFRFDQIEAIHTLVDEITRPDRSKSALVGAGMGSGKTSVSIEVALRSKVERMLVVGVRDAFTQWAESALEQSGGVREMRRVDDTDAGRLAMRDLIEGRSGWFYVGLERLRHADWELVEEHLPVPSYLAGMFPAGTTSIVDPEKKAVQRGTYAKMPPVDLLISDESHRHSNQKSQSLKTMRTIKAHAKIALSGTFYGNKFENAWVVSTWLWGKEFAGTKNKFELDFCVKEPVMSKDGKRQLTTRGGFPLSRITGERIPGEYVETLPCYVFIASPLGPPPEPEIVEVDLLPEQLRQYQELEESSLTWLRDEKGVEAPLIADLPIVQRIRLRTAALGGMTIVLAPDPEGPATTTFVPGSQSSTLNAAYAVLHRPDWVGKKALILTHSKEFAKEAARRIGKKYTVALKTGGVTSKAWDEQKRRFMLPVSETDSIQYLVAVISAVGTATDGLQANCQRVLWLSEDENNVNNIQGANRVWRLGVDLSEYASVKIVSRNTIAVDIAKKNRKHKSGVMDSVRGSR